MDFCCFPLTLQLIFKKYMAALSILISIYFWLVTFMRYSEKRGHDKRMAGQTDNRVLR